MEQYEPELGQMLFGQPSNEFAVPSILEAALGMVREELLRVSGNLGHRNFDPFANQADAFKCKYFGIYAYSWGDEEQPYNFYHLQSGLKLSWYKYFGRGMSCNMELQEGQASRLLEHCIKIIRGVEAKEIEAEFGHLGGVTYFDEPGIAA